MTIEEKDDRVYIAPSKIPGAGKGLFAKVPFAAGDVVEVIGILVRTNSIADECTRYADAYKFRVGDFLLIPMGYGGIVNHSSSPNMEKIIKGQCVYLRALRLIQKDEELLFVYSPYAQERYGLR